MHPWLRPCLIASLSACLGAAPPPRIYDPRDAVYVPMNLEDTYRELDRLMPAKDKAELRKNPEASWKYHFSLGMWMRNNWGLWSGSRLTAALGPYLPLHPDDISGALLLAYGRYLQGKPVSREALATLVPMPPPPAPPLPPAESLPAQEELSDLDGLVQGSPSTPAWVKEAVKARIPVRELAPEVGLICLPQRRSQGVEVREWALGPKGGWVIQRTRDLQAVAWNAREDLVPRWLDLPNRRLRAVQVPGIARLGSAFLLEGVCWAQGSDARNGEQVLRLREGGVDLFPAPPGKGPLSLGHDGTAPVAFRRAPQGEIRMERKVPLWRLQGGIWVEVTRIQEPFEGALRGRRGEAWIVETAHTGGRSLWNPTLETPWVACPQGWGVLGESLPDVQNRGLWVSSKGSWTTGGHPEADWLVRHRLDGQVEVVMAAGQLAFTEASLWRAPEGRMEGGWQDQPWPEGAQPGGLTAGALLEEGPCLMMLGRRHLWRLEQQQIQLLATLEGTDQTLTMPGGDRLLWRWDPRLLHRLPDGSLLAGGHWGGLYRFTSVSGTWRAEAWDDEPAALNLKPMRWVIRGAKDLPRW